MLVVHFFKTVGSLPIVNEVVNEIEIQNYTIYMMSYFFFKFVRVIPFDKGSEGPNYSSPPCPVITKKPPFIYVCACL